MSFKPKLGRIEFDSRARPSILVAARQSYKLLLREYMYQGTAYSAVDLRLRVLFLALPPLTARTSRFASIECDHNPLWKDLTARITSLFWRVLNGCCGLAVPR